MRAPELKVLYKETIDDINKIKAALDHIEEQKKQALDSNLEISGNEDDEGILNKIKKMQIEANEKIELIREIYAELCGNEEEEEGDNGIKGELDDLLKDFRATQEKIKSAEKELHGYEEKTEVEGEEKHIDGLMDKMKNFFEGQKIKYDEKYKEIEEKLLPGATTVGLSAAYTEKADSYKKPNIFWLVGFFISIIFIALLLINLYFGWIGQGIDELFENLEEKINPILLIARFTINIGIISSLIWVANFAGKRYNQNKRLSEEYSYKATFAKSFEGYRKKAEELDQLSENRELSEKLMNKMIEMNAVNPVKTMESKSHKENHPTMKVLEKSLEAISKLIDIIGKTKN